MQEATIVKDEALGARLQACRQLFLRLDAGTAGPVSVRLPEGGAAAPGLKPGPGLRAAGALLAYALLGREDDRAQECVNALADGAEERSLRRVCRAAADMLAQSPAFSQAALYACLRTAIVFLPESGPAATLPGLVEAETPQTAARAALEARWAWAGENAIAYFDLPEGVDRVWIDGEEHDRRECAAGVCVKNGADGVAVRWEGGEALLEPGDAMKGFRCEVGFRFRRLFAPARRTPRWLWPRLAPWLRVRGPADSRTPPMTIATSRGRLAAESEPLPQGVCYLRCPGLDPRADAGVELRYPGLRIIDLTGEG